jgi:hypothetical protein
LNIIKWALKNGFQCNNYIFGAAAAYGHLRILKWGIKNEYLMPEIVVIIDFVFTNKIIH